jgi:hypothetical protein
MWLAKGIPSDPNEALMWMAQVCSGVQDDRVPQFARQRQRLVVFKVKADAAKLARKKTNEYWSGKVRRVGVV